MLVRTLGAASAAALACFSARRALLTIAALVPPRRPAPGAAGELPSVAVVVAARDESGSIHRLLEALERLDYPSNRLSIVLVDDCSKDDTASHLRRWADARPNARVVELKRRVGKARALDEGLAGASADVVAIYDADHAPHPDSLELLARAFQDEALGAAAGMLWPENAASSPTARYAAVEAWVHQLVTSQGKDRLDLNPPALGGNCAYRWTALEQLGWFREGAYSEDTETTVALSRAGWRTRFVAEAVTDNLVVSTLPDYWRQHIRWTRGSFDAGTRRPAAVTGPLHRRVEAWALSASYVDRVAFVIASGLVAAGRLPRWLLSVYLAIPALQVIFALAKARVGHALPRYLACLPPYFVVDAAASATAALLHLLRWRRDWRSPREA